MKKNGAFAWYVVPKLFGDANRAILTIHETKDILQADWECLFFVPHSGKKQDSSRRMDKDIASMEVVYITAQIFLICLRAAFIEIDDQR